jgi:chemotaxis-related protein WspB
MLFLLFQLGSDRYALPAKDVVEVLPLLAWKEITGVTAGLAGLLDYRGAAIPAIDLNALALGRPAARRVSTRVFIARYPLPNGETRSLGLIAERATEMLNRRAEDFQPSNVHAENARYLGPVTHDARGLIQRVEVTDLLTDEVRSALFPATGGISGGAKTS